MNQAVRITGTKGVYISKYIPFDPSKPENTKFEHLVVAGDDGADESIFTKTGHIRVGMARGEIEFMSPKEMTASAVVALRKQKDAVIADAQREATQIEQQIQSLLAITNEAQP